MHFSLRPSEMRDLRAIAEAWGVPTATVTWVIVHDQLARWRRRASDLGPAGLEIAAATAVLQRARARMPDATPPLRSVPQDPRRGRRDAS